jgi:integrase/recombinase XerD
MAKLPDILTPDEETALLSVFNRRYPTAERNRLMVLLALRTGMRVGDLVNLQWSDIELDTGRCHIKNGKGKKDRVIFIKAEILSDLVDLAKRFGGLPVGYVFTTLKGEPLRVLSGKNKGKVSPYLRTMIARQAEKAGIEKRVHFHLLRHTYLTRLYSHTKDIDLVKDAAGHANMGTTQIYVHTSGEDLRDAMLSMPEPGTPAPATVQDTPEFRAMLELAMKTAMLKVAEDSPEAKARQATMRNIEAVQAPLRGVAEELRAASVKNAVETLKAANLYTPETKAALENALNADGFLPPDEDDEAATLRKLEREAKA